MENFDKKLAQYGILAKNGKIVPKDNKITIINAEIKEINFQTLQEAGIKEICILESEIKYLYFLEKNTIKIDFRNCNFKNQIIARKAYFENEVIFQQCIFDAVVDFSKTKFDSRVDFLASVFKGEVRFIETQFQAEQSNNETIENDFEEVIFEGRASFSNATFQARVCFGLSQFKSEANFANTKFQASQNDSNIIENQFLRVVFIGKTIFNHATFKARVDFRLSQFKEEVRFIETQFLAEKDSNKIIENDFRETIFEREVSFDNVIFQTGISFAFSQFKNEVRLSISNFLYAKNINFIDIVFGKLVLQKELFEKSVNFKRCIFLQDVNFKDYTFNEIAFNTCIFKENAYFNNSNFTKGVDFHECEFEKTACFYGVKFDETPNFSQALFKSNINIINSNLNFDFTKLDKKIRLLSLQGEGKYDYEIANDFRDSFRNFKSALIKDNNLLDASNFHKYELYCKEIELENKKDNTLKDRIDKWQLFFYRKLCDHHTDLLLNLRWLVVAIGLFALLYFASRVIQDINLLKVLNQYGVCLSMIGVFNLFCLYWFECIKKFDFFVYLNLIVVLWVICYMPKIIFGIVNIIGGKSYNGFENALITIYTILLALVLFSLQKTARKNSIVPS
ncbi:TPA: pentapeptide repeat-containing protein [Campylobacter coli]|nr:pentapeptide repeat-containing protein [Campylobacter coli]